MPVVGDPPPKQQSTRENSLAAYEAILPQATNLRETVWAYIEANPHCTDEQIAIDLDLNPSTARPRRIDLLKEGRVAVSGSGTNRSGRKAATWVVVYHSKD